MKSNKQVKKKKLGSKIDNNFNESKDFEEDPLIITQSEIQYVSKQEEIDNGKERDLRQGTLWRLGDEQVHSKRPTRISYQYPYPNPNPFLSFDIDPPTPSVTTAPTSPSSLSLLNF